MDFGIFGGVDYQNPAMPAGWPRRPKYYDHALGREAHKRALEFYELGDDLGIDFMTVSEHHYGVPSIEPNCLIFATELALRLKNSRVALLGPNLPMNNPIRIAEEVAMLDLTTDGNLYAVALLRGTPNEALSYYSNPGESRARWEEEVNLILRAWREPEPFGWEGEYYRYRTVAVWPQPQAPGPRVMLSGNSPESVDFAVEMGQDLAMSYAPLEVIAAQTERFIAGSAERGRTVGRENVLYRNFVYVSESKEKAIEECSQTKFGSMVQFRPPNKGAAAPFQEIVTKGYANHAAAMAKGAAPEGWGLPTIMGTPDEVYEKIKEYHAAGVGAIDFSFGGFGLPYDLAKKNLEMFCREVLPEAKKLSTAPEPVATAA